MRDEVAHEGHWIDSARQTVEETFEAVLAATEFGKAARRR